MRITPLFLIIFLHLYGVVPSINFPPSLTTLHGRLGIEKTLIFGVILGVESLLFQLTISLLTSTTLYLQQYLATFIIPYMECPSGNTCCVSPSSTKAESDHHSFDP